LNLKQLTAENHRSAERKDFAKILLSGNIDPFLYYKYLINQSQNYVVLESALRELAFPEEFRSIFRAKKIIDDMHELEEIYGFTYSELICKSTQEYVGHIENLLMNEDVDGIISHLYVRHFGDMYGGAIIAKRVPGSGTMYQFENKEEMKQNVRLLLNDNMADEANKCFAFAIRLFEELLHEERIG
jgi:heme oxygenase